MTPGDVLADRFEITEVARNGDPLAGRDRETGRPVIIVSIHARDFLDVVATRGMAALVPTLDDPRLTRVLSVDPLVLEAPPAQEELTDREWIDAAIELVDVLCGLRRAGVHARPWNATALRGPDGVQVRVAAPSPPGLHFFQSDRFAGLAGEVAWWLEERTDGTVGALSTESPAALLAGLASRASPRGAARATEIDAPSEEPPLPSRAIDFDRAIALGERELAALAGSPASRAEYAVLGLAAAYHHRGCVAWERGDRARALADVDRAIELDPHARHLTTRALYAEALGDVARAEALHDRAVAAIQKPTILVLTGRTPLELFESGMDPPRRVARDAARTHHARGALRARRGDLAGALSDLEEAQRRHPSEAIARALVAIRARLDGAGP